MMKTGIIKTLLWCGFVSSAALAANSALALCSDGRHPDAVAELKVGDMVATVIVVSRLDESSPDDPQGIEDTLYTVRVLDIFKGKPGPSLKIRSENTSSRFPMDVGKKYLLFITNDGQAHFVDSCGRSGLLKDRAMELEALRKQVSRHCRGGRVAQ